MIVGLLLGPVAGVRAAEAYGSISGQVTEASSHVPAQGVEVCAFSTNIELFEEEPGESAHHEGCAKTDASGEYTISGLDPESYYVAFGDPPQSKLDYVPQYYDDKLLSGEASAVVVSAEKTTPSIDAELTLGGEITGRLTDAETGAPIEKGFVCVFQTNAQGALEVRECEFAEPNGIYTIRGLLSGGYKVGFAAAGFEVQYYNDKSSLAEAELVSVLAPTLTQGINASLKPAPPVTAPPTSTGPGVANPTGLPTKSSTTGTAQASTVALKDTRIAVASDKAVVRLACTGAGSCRVKVTFRLERTITVKGKKRHSEVVIGKSGALSIAAGGSLTTRVGLDSMARKLLRAGRGRLKVDLALAVVGGGKHDKRVTLVAQKAKRKK